MKTLFVNVRSVVLGSLVASAVACQQQPSTIAKTPPTEPAMAVAPANPAVELVAEAAADPTSLPQLAQDAQQFLAHYNLAKLIQMDGSSSYELMNGFFGPDHYRIEFAMLEVKADSARPGHFWVKGKNRFKKRITPFEGEIIFTSLHNQPPYTPAKEEEVGAEIRKSIAELNARNLYCAQGTFRLQEAVQTPGAGVFAGKVVMDFGVDEDGELSFISRNKEFGARRGDILFEGSWTNLAGQQRKALTLVKDIFLFDQHIFNNFLIGERDPSFNPKYAKLGWNSYWENDEWWAEPGLRRAEATVAAEEAPEAADSTLGI